MDKISRKIIERMIIPPDCTIKTAMQAIGKGKLGAAFIVNGDDESFLGVLTDGDVRRALLKGHGLKSNIEVIARPEPVVAMAGTSLEEISRLLDEKIRILPILNEKKQIVDVHYLDKRSFVSVLEPTFDEKEIEYVTDCIVSGWVSSIGKYVGEFEHLMSEYCNAEYGVSCSSGTTALHMALLAYGIGPGDEVIVPSLTFIATANAVTYTGAKPVFVDSDPLTWNIDPAQIENAITPRTKAIIPVHLYGLPADMDPILGIAKDHNLHVIEDAAEAHGATYKNKKVGTLGDAGVFSFFGNKIITTGEGGMIVTNDKEIADKCRMLRDHGMSKDKRYWHTVLGYNYRMTNLQAALGVAQIGKIDAIITKKKKVAELYTENLGNIPGITLPANVDWAENVFWLYTILINEQTCGVNAEQIRDKCREEGIDTRPIFPPMHTQPIYKTGQSLPISEKLSSQGICLPSSPDIDRHTIQKICNIIRENINNF